MSEKAEQHCQKSSLTSLGELFYECTKETESFCSPSETDLGWEEYILVLLWRRGVHLQDGWCRRRCRGETSTISVRSSFWIIPSGSSELALLWRLVFLCLSRWERGSPPIRIMGLGISSLWSAPVRSSLRCPFPFLNYFLGTTLRDLIYFVSISKIIFSWEKFIRLFFCGSKVSNIKIW